MLRAEIKCSRLGLVGDRVSGVHGRGVLVVDRVAELLALGQRCRPGPPLMIRWLPLLYAVVTVGSSPP